MVVFPNGVEEVIQTCLIIVADDFCNEIAKGPYTIVPMILSEIDRALGCCKNRAKKFEGCNLLLQLQLIDHVQKVHGLQRMCTPTGDDNIAAY